MFLGVMILTLAAPVLGSRRWFPHNAFGRFLLILAGALTGAMLWAGGLPPIWFAGGKEGFGIVLTFVAMAFGFSNAETKFYVWPWLLSWAAVMLIANVWALVRAHV